MEPTQEPQGSNVDLVMSYVDDLPFPVTKLKLIEHARTKSAPVRVLNVLAKLQVQAFNRVDDVAAALRAM